MASDVYEKAKKARLKKAQELADSLKDGTYKAAAFSKEDSWFPKRKIIEKDKNALEVIHGDYSKKGKDND